MFDVDEDSLDEIINWGESPLDRMGALEILEARVFNNGGLEYQKLLKGAESVICEYTSTAEYIMAMNEVLNE